MNGKKKIFLLIKNLCSKTFKLSFLEKNNQAELSEKKTNFYKNILNTKILMI